MSNQTTVLYVLGKRLNVRTTPRIEKDNIIDSVSAGDPLEVLTFRAEQSPDRWVWRRLADAEDRWVAEYNSDAGKRLLGTEAPPVETGGEPETLYAVGETTALWSSPVVRPGDEVQKLALGDAVQVVPEIKRIGPAGWVWRQVVSADSRLLWTMEYNARTLQRLLSRTPPAGAVQGRVRTDGQRFLLDGKPFRFVGANLRELPFYGRTDILHLSESGLLVEQLAEMLVLGMRVVRLHACHNRVSVGEARGLLGTALDRIHEHGLLTVVVLNDALGSFWVQGDERFHRHVLGHLDKVAYFHQEGFRENYLPFVRDIVSAYADHPAIFAWELGNEYAIHPQPASPEDGEAFLRFARVMSDVIRAIDPNHLVTTGLVNTGHVAPNDRPGLNRLEYGKRLYSLPNLDFLTVHFYEDNGEEQNSLLDLEIARQVNKPLIVEEWGARGSNRAELTAAKLAFWFDHGASGFMQWGLCATQFNIGVGDDEFGLDRYADGNRDHYQPLCDLYRDWGRRLGE